MRRRLRIAIVFAIGLFPCGAARSDDGPKSGPDLSEFKTVDTAATTRIRVPTDSAREAGPGYLGILFDPEAQGKAVVESIDSDSPAARAGLQVGDVLTKVDGREVSGVAAVFEILAAKAAGQDLEIAVSRKDQFLAMKAALSPWSRPRTGQERPKPTLGIQVTDAPKAGDGVVIEQVRPGSVADRAKLKVGELLLKVDGVPITGPDQLRDLIAEKPAGSKVVTTLLLAEKAVDLAIPLDPESASETSSAGIARRRGGGMRAGGGGYWTKPGFRLAILCVEYPDIKHNEKISKEAWEQALFSEGTFNKTNATGQSVQGSFRDYFLEQSCGYFKVEGKVFDWVEASKKRPEYATGSRLALLTEAMDKVLERDGKDALKDFDGVFFIYAGGRYPAPRGSLYWPHRSTMSHKGKRWPYFIIEEGGTRMQGLSVLCHEFGHMLSLPDLYARPENPGSEGLGIWCCMSQQPNRSVPQHFSAWAKEKVGWLKPAVIDPTIKQKLILAPVEGSPKECFKVLVRDDGSEYYLLENRRRVKFDKSLPAEGLLIWHVLGNRPTLIESHGVGGPSGPNVFRTEVPYPSSSNDAFTPYTTPSSRSPLGGGKPVHITNIRRLDDGSVSFHIGYEYQ